MNILLKKSYCKFFSIIVILLLLIFPGLSLKAQEKLLIDDNFQNISQKWIPFALEGNMSQISNQKELLKIISDTSSIAGIYNKTPLSGQFVVDVDFAKDNNVMVALFHKKADGTIDKENYSALCVENTGSYVKVFLTDKQNGVNDVLDNTHQVSAGKYSSKLDGSVYSIPFHGTNKKIRILHDELSGFFHFYYAVKAKINGVQKSGWMEIFPSKEWGPKNQEYLVGLLANKGEIVYHHITVKNVPTTDVSDLTTGFAVRQREYTWSGYQGNAIVVTFGNEFPFWNRDYKWVFWDQANYVPVWRLSNDLQFTYEFVEEWGGGHHGCYEPMSDRLLRYSYAEILEDNDVRKVIHWHYALINANYQYPDDWVGKQIPEVDEFYYVYPDGQIVRRILFFPKLDSDYRSWHELTEMIVIAGDKSNPSDNLSSPALSLFDLKYHLLNFFGNNTDNHFYSDNWDAFISATHFKNYPDAIGAFIQDSIPGKRVFMRLDWQSTGYKFTHWPVNKVPYNYPCKTFTPWKGMVSHTSLIGGGVNTGVDWNYNYKVKNGRKYRQWSSLIFLNKKNSLLQAQNVVKSWEGTNDVTLNDTNFSFLGYKREEKLFELKDLSGQPKSFNMTIKPDGIIINPVIRIKNWGKKKVLIKVGGQEVRYRQWVYENNDLIIWIESSFTTEKEIEIIATGNDYTSIKKNYYNGKVSVYPNPTSDYINVSLKHSSDNTKVQLVDLYGNILYEKTHPNKHFTISLTAFKEGIYIFKVQNGSSFVSKRIIKLNGSSFVSKRIIKLAND